MLRAWQAVTAAAILLTGGAVHPDSSSDPIYWWPTGHTDSSGDPINRWPAVHIHKSKH